MLEQKKCQNCGALVLDDFKFCARCGSEIELEEKETVCPVCSFVAAPEAFYCPKCGTNIQKHCNTDLDTVQRKKSSHQNGKRIRDIVKKTFLAFVSLCMLVLAFFPILSYKIDMSNDYEIDIKISAIDSVVYCIDSMFSLDKEELEDSALAERVDDYWEDLYEAMSEEGNDVEVERLGQKYVHAAMRLGLRSEHTKLSASRIVSTVIALAYIALAIALLILSVLDIAFYYAKRERPVYGKTATTILTLIPPLVVSLYTSFSIAYCANIPCDIALNSTVVVTIILAVATIAWLAIDRMLLNGRSSVNVGVIVGRSIAFIAAFFLMISALLPVASLSVRTVFEGDSKKSTASASIYSSYFEALNMTEEELETLEDPDESAEAISEWFSYLNNYSRREFRKGETISINSAILTYALCGFGGAQAAWFFGLMPLLTILISLMAAVLIWQITFAVVNGHCMHESIWISAKIIGVALSVIVLIIVIFFLFITTNNLGYPELPAGERARVSIGASSIVALVSSIIASCIPASKV